MDLFMTVATAIFTENVIAAILLIRIRELKKERRRNSIRYRKRMFSTSHIIDLKEKEWVELDA